MRLLALFSLLSASFFLPFWTSGAPAEPLHRTISRWIVWTIILAAVVWLAWTLATHRRGSTTTSSGPTIQQIRQLAELVTANVTIADVRETNLSGHLGGVHALLIVRGDVLLGPDLSKAKILSCDQAERLIMIELPRPKVISYRLDHSCTKLVSLSHDGLWVVVPGDAGRTAVLNRAYAEAEQSVAAAAVKPSTIGDASHHAEQALAVFFAMAGWKVQIEWAAE